MKKLIFGLAVVLYPLSASTQTITSIGAPAVKAADDFATQTFQDPWDMNQRTDLGWILNSVDGPVPGINSVSFAGGLFTGVTANTDPSLFFLESGFPAGISSPIGKIGTVYPSYASTSRFSPCA